MSTSPGKTYQIAACSQGCAYHSTTGGTCGICGAALTAPETADRQGARDILLHERDGKYAAGKAGALAWLKARQA